MEEPREVQTDENRTAPEKKQKRIVKTPAQVAALEKFYSEQKYPSEATKLELAEAIGLTEKQVSGWFCHRRLKDKKSPNDEVQALGKQDRSSGVIQDRGSGLRQDSCGSTKQGDNKHCDLKEVESRRFTTEGVLPTELRYEVGSHHNSVMDDTSSGSSSPLKDSIHQQNVDRLAVATSKYPSHNDVKIVKGRPGPSGYLKVKGQVENAAITAVKRQLGRHYREDGPPLGIEFEPLPPGAFENPVKIPVTQSFYVGDRTALQSLDGSRTFQQPNASKMHERYNSKIFHPVDLDESGFEIRHGSKHREKYPDNQYKQTPLITSKHSNSASGRNLHMEINENSAGETSVQDLHEHFERRTKHGPSRHPIPYGKIIDGNQAENYSRSYKSGAPKVTYRDRIEPVTSGLTVKRSEFVEFEDRGLSSKAPKDDKFDEYSKLVPAKIPSGTEMMVTKRSRDEFAHQAYPRVVEEPPGSNKIKRSAAEMSSSFSEDETAETYSSGD